MKELKDLKITPAFYEYLYKEILEAMKRFYSELIGNVKINNSNDPLEDAIIKNRIVYEKNGFVGKFNKTTSQTLVKLGAQWDQRQRKFKIPLFKLPANIINAISLSKSISDANIQELMRRLETIESPKLLIEDSLQKIIDSASENIDRNLNEVPVIKPQIDEKSLKKEYSENLDLDIKTWSDKEVLKLREKIVERTKKGLRYEGVIESIKKEFDVTPAKAKFLARQETHLMLAAIRKEKYQKAGMNKYRWKTLDYPVGTKKGNVRPSHAVLDDKIFDWEHPPIVDKETGRTAHPGEDFDCFPSDTKIFSPIPEKIFRRKFVGELAEFVTDKGAFRATLNHPILTRNGWVAAQHINVRDNIFNISSDGMTSGKSNPNYIHSDFDKMFSFFDVLFNRENVASSPVDFHGDASIDNQVDVVTINRNLSFDFMPDIDKGFLKFIFTDADVKIHSLPCNGDFLSMFPVMFNAPDCIMSGLGKVFPILFSGKAHPIEHTFAAISWLDSIAAQIIRNGSSGDIVPLGKREDTFTIFKKRYQLFFWELFCVVGRSIMSYILMPNHLELDTQVIGTNSKFPGDFPDIHPFSIESCAILEKRIIELNGHVFNLQNKDGWYFANNIISKNCRCTAIPLWQGE